jgi:hypothetical protein
MDFFFSNFFINSFPVEECNQTIFSTVIAYDYLV